MTFVCVVGHNNLVYKKQSPRSWDFGAGLVRELHQSVDGFRGLFMNKYAPGLLVLLTYLKVNNNGSETMPYGMCV